MFLESLANIAKHMMEEHPNENQWGDTLVSNGEVISQKCQICGKELIPTKAEKCFDQEVL